MPRIAAVASALPPHRYSQDELIAAFRDLWSERHFNLDRIEQFHRNVLVGGRCLSLPLEEYRQLQGLGKTNAAWTTAALEIGERVARAALQQAQLPALEIDHFISTTITGLAVPSIEARLMNRMPFPRHMKRTPVFGLGCLAGAAGIARLHDYLNHSDEAGMLLSVELCSLTLQREDLSIANIVSSGLFGDGAASVLMLGEDHPAVRPEMPETIDSRAIFFPDSERVMGWDVVDTGFKIVLSSEVASFAAAHLRPGIEDFLADHGLKLKDIALWIAHPGGPKVISAMAEALDLPEDALELSRQSLAEVGNLSSASVLFILKESLERKRPPRGSYGVLVAMGPAFCAEAVLIRF
ncbi:MAG: hypothetical protein K1X75_17170 [Leptospirales bacterium]|nr:hypothetical protein [Leptospirales bacterium]